MHCSAITASYHFASLHFHYEKRAERGKASAVQWKHTHTPRVESEAIAFLSCKEPEKKNRIHFPHFTIEEARCSIRISCSRTQGKFVPEIN